MSFGRSLTAPGIVALTVLAAFHPLWLADHTAAATAAAVANADLPVADPRAAQLAEAEVLWAARALRGGEPSTWHHARGLGVHCAEHWLPTMFHPLRLLLQSGDEPSSRRIDWIYVLRILIAAAGTWLLARRIGLRGAAAVVAGVSFALGGVLMRQLHMPFLDGAVLLPWGLLCADLVGATVGVAATVAFALVWFWVVAGGGGGLLLPSTAALALWAWQRRSRWSRRARRQVVAAALCATGLAGAAWLPEWRYGGSPIDGARTPDLLEALAGTWVAAPFDGDVPFLAHSTSVLVTLLVLAMRSVPSRLLGIGLSVALPSSGAWAPLRPFAVPTALALALCAGWGLAVLGARSVRRGVVRGATAVAMLVLLGAVVGALSADGERTPFVGAGAAVGRLAVLGVAVAAVAAVPLPWRAGALAGLLAVELVATAPDGWTPRPIDENALWDGPPWLHQLREPIQSRGRLAIDAPRPSPWDCFRHELADAAPPFGRRVDRAAALWERFSSRPADDRVLDLLGVRQRVTAGADAPVIVRRDAPPLAFFPARIEPVRDRDEALSRMVEPDWQPRAVAFLEGGPVGHGPGEVVGSAGRMPPSRAGSIRLRTQVTEPAFFVIAVEPHPALRIAVDERLAPVLPADGAVSAVLVPRGRHTVEVWHDADPAGLAAWLAAASSLGLVLMLWRVGRKPTGAIDRRSPGRQDISPSPPASSRGEVLRGDCSSVG